MVASKTGTKSKAQNGASRGSKRPASSTTRTTAPGKLEHALAEAIQAGDLVGVRSALRAGASPNARWPGYKGGTLFFVAAREAPKKVRAKIVRLVGEAGANVAHRGQNGWTALHWAVVGEDADTVQELLRLGVDPKVKDNKGNTPFDHTDGTERAEAGMRRLLKEALHGTVELATAELEDAVSRQKLPLVRKMLAAGVTPSAHALVVATSRHLDIKYLELLLQHGADPDAANAIWNAAASGNAAAAEVLIKAGADLGLDPHGEDSPLEVALWDPYDGYPVARLLIRAAMERARGSKRQAAKLLRVSLGTLEKAERLTSGDAQIESVSRARRRTP